MIRFAKRAGGRDVSVVYTPTTLAEFYDDTLLILPFPFIDGILLFDAPLRIAASYGGEVHRTSTVVGLTTGLAMIGEAYTSQLYLFENYELFPSTDPILTVTLYFLSDQSSPPASASPPTLSCDAIYTQWKLNTARPCDTLTLRRMEDFTDSLTFVKAL